MDQKLWESSSQSTKQLEADFTPWAFSENAVNVGNGKMPVSQDIILLLALFDVISTSITLSTSPSDNSSFMHLKKYCILLRQTTQAQMDGGQGNKTIETCPLCLEPWLWRTALGRFQHDQADHEFFIKSVGYDREDGCPFPVTCEFQTLSLQIIVTNNNFRVGDKH